MRAFRGTRRSSVYRSHTLAGPAASRITAVAATSRAVWLRRLSGDSRLGKADARKLADEARALLADPRLLEVHDDLAAIVSVASWCARASGDAWLTISSR